MSELEHAKKKSTKTVSGISWFFIACSTLGIFWGVKKYKDGQNNSLPVSKIEKKRPHSVKFSFNSENLTFRCEKFHVELLDESGAPSKSGAYIKATNESSGILVTLFNKSTCGTDGAPSTQLSVPEGSSSADIFLKLEEPATLTLEADDEKGAPISLNGENRIKVSRNPNYFGLKFISLPTSISVCTPFLVSLEVKDDSGKPVSEGDKPVVLEVLTEDPKVKPLKISETIPKKGVALFQQPFFCESYGKYFRLRATVGDASLTSESIERREFSPFPVTFEVEGMGTFKGRMVRQNMGEIFGEYYEFKVIGDKKVIQIKDSTYELSIPSPFLYVLKKR